jgi:hypothetical protein
MTTDLERRPTNPDAPTLDESRNSYFRRVSMLPASTISKAVSPAMLMFIDAVRGLLFALTHLHSALRQYVNFAVSDRVAGVFARVLEPAGGYLSNLINALDRFDSTSRRTAPPVTAVRGVVDAAKESIAVFGKIVAVLRFQTPAFRDADVRYTRQLLLSIYGGMAEIAQSWKTIAPLLVEIKPILHPEAARALGAPMSKSNSMSGRTPISPIPESGEAHSPERTRPLAASTSALTPGPASYAAAVAAPGQSPPNFTSPRGKNRRHAGSFSTEDVERGMMMGVPGQGQVHAHAHPPHTPRNDWPDLSRTIFEDNEAMADTAPPPFPLHAEPEPPNVTPPQVLQRDALPPIVTSFAAARGRHAAMSSSGSSLYAQSGAGGGVRSLSVDVRPPTPASATLFDEDLLDQIETTTDLAFNVWLRLSEDINAPLAAASAYAHGKSDSISSASGLDRTPLSAKQYSELVQNLSRAEQVTMTLRASLMGLRANPFAYAHASLPENAQTFIFQVVKLLNVIKALSPHRQFSTPTRQGLSQLTQATRECAILIQVSSLQPSSAASASASLSMSASASASASASISASASSASVVGGAGQDPGFGGYKPGFGPEPSASQVMLAHEAEADRERERVAENEADSHLHDGKPDFKPNFTLGAPRSAEDTGPGLRDLPPVRERAA